MLIEFVPVDMLTPLFILFRLFTLVDVVWGVNGDVKVVDEFKEEFILDEVELFILKGLFIGFNDGFKDNVIGTDWLGV